MTIICNSPLVADPASVVVPGRTTLSFDALAIPASTTARVHYEILDKASALNFSNGTKFADIQHPVSDTQTTTVPFNATFICEPSGRKPELVTISATVFENGAPQCGPMFVDVGIAAWNCVALNELDGAPELVAASVRSTGKKKKAKQRRVTAASTSKPKAGKSSRGKRSGQ
jgi:hypothetical protein